MTDRQSGFWSRGAQWLRRLLSDQPGNRHPREQAPHAAPSQSKSNLPFPQSLEPRIYYDASPLGALLSAPALEVSASDVNSEILAADPFEPAEASDTTELTAPTIDLRIDTTASVEMQSHVREVIFVDGGIADVERLWQAISNDQQTGMLDG